MCLLTYFPEEQQPDTDRLFNGSMFNDDGHGFAIVADNRLIIRHSMDAEQLIDDFAKLRKTNPQGPAIFHSRFSTGGAKDITNCHPFYVGKDARTVLAHNGILFHSKEKNRSDTKIFAEDMLPKSKFRNLDNRRKFAKFEAYLGEGNKVAILTVNPRYRQNAYLLNMSQGEWVDGVWYSNSGYQSFISSRQYGKYLAQHEWPTVLGPAEHRTGADCAVCFSKGTVNLIVGFCTFCRSCQDCGEDEYECMCWTPRTLDNEREEVNRHLRSIN